MIRPNLFEVHGNPYAHVTEDRHVYTNALDAHKRVVSNSIKLLGTFNQDDEIVNKDKRAPLSKDTLLRDFDKFDLFNVHPAPKRN